MPGDINVDAGSVLGGLGTLAGQIRSAITGELSPEAKAKLEEAALAADAASMAAQAAINQVEAGSTSLFIAGWRPAVGWVCVAALLWTYILQPSIAWATGNPGPKIDIGELYPLLLGMLGLVGARSYEKVQGVQGKH